MSDPRLQQPQCNLSLSLLGLDDELTEFRDSCTFFCDAAIALLRASEQMDRSTLGGMGAYAEQIKQKINELQTQLTLLRTQTLARGDRH